MRAPTRARAAARASGGRWTPVALLIVGALAVASLLWAAFAPGAQGDIARALAETLRCPSCAGESVADSTAPVAVAMREEAERQLAEGRSPAEVRAWFAQRFGDEVLLDPPLRGAGVVLWAAPLLVLGAGAVLLVRGARTAERRRAAVALGVAGVVMAAGALVAAVERPAVPAGDEVTAADAGSPSTREVLRAAVERTPADHGLRVALAVVLLEARADAAAVEHLEAAARLRPTDTRTMYLLADALLGVGDAAAAGTTLDRLLEVDPEHSPSLLLRGTMLWREQDDRAVALLERFLAAHGDDPAAERVEAMLAEASP